MFLFEFAPQILSKRHIFPFVFGRFFFRSPFVLRSFSVVSPSIDRRFFVVSSSFLRRLSVVSPSVDGEMTEMNGEMTENHPRIEVNLYNRLAIRIYYVFVNSFGRSVFSLYFCIRLAWCVFYHAMSRQRIITRQ